ncbi:MAG: hypothetical protein WD795_16340 [Woeseia sp.]
MAQDAAKLLADLQASVNWGQSHLGAAGVAGAVAAAADTSELPKAKFGLPEGLATAIGAGFILGPIGGLILGGAQGILSKRDKQSALDAMAAEQESQAMMDMQFNLEIDEQITNALPKDVEQLKTIQSAYNMSSKMMQSQFEDTRASGIKLREQALTERMAFAQRNEAELIAGQQREENAEREMGTQAWERLNTVSDDLHRESAPFLEQRSAYGRVMASAAEPSAAGDLALIFNYMKILDPGSVVRESEFATAANTGAVDERTRGIYNKLLTGERLTDVQRGDFVARSGALFKQAVSDQTERNTRYLSRAKEGGVPDQYLKDLAIPTGVGRVDYNLPSPNPETETSGASQSELVPEDGGVADYVAEGLDKTVGFVDEVADIARRKNAGVERMRDPITGQTFDVQPDGSKVEVHPGTIVNGKRLQNRADGNGQEWVAIPGAESKPPKGGSLWPDSGRSGKPAKTFTNRTGTWERIDYPDGSFQWVRKDKRPTDD